MQGWLFNRRIIDGPHADSSLNPLPLSRLFLRREFLNCFLKTPQEAQGIYREMLEEGQKIKMGEVFEDRRAIHDFQWSLSSVFHFLGKLAPLRKDEPIKHWDETELEERIAAFAKGRIHPLPLDKEAKRYLVEQLISRGFTRREIAQKLGLSRKTIYNLIAQPPK